MMRDPVERILGIEPTDDPRALLGLPARPLTAADVERALARQLRRIERHPESHTEDATTLRDRLRSAAATLGHTVGAQDTPARPRPIDPRARRAPVRPKLTTPPPSAAPGSPPPVHLTPFDRRALAILVGFGGWNARSRAHLTALAASHGVSARGLMLVVKGLSGLARTRHHHLDVREITAGSRRMEAGTTVRHDPYALALGRHFRDQPHSDPENDRDPMMRTIRFAAVAGLITILAAVVIARLVVTDPVAPKERTAANARPVDPPVVVTPAIDTPAQTARVRSIFEELPDFTGSGTPIEAIRAADDVVDVLPEEFDAMLRRLEVSGDLTEPTRRNWAISLDTLATGWVLLDRSTNDARRTEVKGILRVGAANAETSDTLLQNVTPVSPRLGDPLDVWRSTWAAGMLTEIAGSTELPPVVVDRARLLADVVFENTGGTPARRTFDAGAGLWLDLIITDLVNTLDGSTAAFSRWELWLNAVRELGVRTEQRDLILSAITRVVRERADLTRDSPGSQVLGRLLRAGRWSTDSAARARLLDLYDDPSVPARHLWGLTSQLAVHPDFLWFDESLIVPPEADRPHRRRLRDQLASAWQTVDAADGRASHGRALDVVPEVLVQWRNAAATLRAEPLSDQAAALTARLVDLSRLNEAAAYLGAGEPQAALTALREVNLGAESAARSTQLTDVGQPIGGDGRWAATYEDDETNNREKRVQLLNRLLGESGTDLGPIDARRLVREAYRGTSGEVRITAQQVVLQQFARGPQVLATLLEQFSRSIRSRQTRTFIEQLTGTPLPPVRDEAYHAAARLALARRAAAARSTAIDREAGLVDGYTARLTESVLHRSAIVSGRPPGATGAAADPARAADRLRTAWLSIARDAMTSEPTPGPLAELERRAAVRNRLARDPIQQFVAGQLACADLIAYITVAEQPGQRDGVLQRLNEGLSERRGRPQALQQSVAAEQLIVDLWWIRLGADDLTEDAS